MIAGKLTDHFTWAEVTLTQQRGVDNDLPIECVANVKNTAYRLEVIRSALGNVPLIISSWYRSPELNKKIGGSKNSDHMKGNAVDFICPKYGSPFTICKRLVKMKDMIMFKQLIQEHNWVHISFDPDPGAIPELEVLTLLSSGGYAIGLTDKLGNKLA